MALALGCAENSRINFPSRLETPQIGTTDTGPAKVYVLAGQSNAGGCGWVADLSQAQAEAPADAHIYLYGCGQPQWVGIWTPLIPGDGGDSAEIGPELGFAQSMPAPFYMIKFAVGGTSMNTFWCPPDAGGPFAGYVNLLEAVRAGLASASIPGGAHIAGLIWLQGESDAPDFESATNYAARLKCFITDFRGAIGEPNLPVVVAQIHDAGWPYTSIVQAAQANIVNVLPNVATFQTEDIPIPAPTNPHFGGPEQIIIGQRFAAAMQLLTPD